MRNYYKHSSFQLIKCTEKREDITTKNRQKKIPRNNHEGKTIRLWINETAAKRRRSLYWASISREIWNYVNNCENCQATSYDRDRPKQKNMLTPTPNRPFIKIKSFWVIVDTVKHILWHKLMGKQKQKN